MTGAAFIQNIDESFIGIVGFVLISGCDFVKNSAESEGGALYIQNIDGNVTISENVFKQNSASGDAGMRC